MSEALSGGDGREDAEQRKDSRSNGNGPAGGKRDSSDAAGVKRDSDTSSGSEVLQRQTQQAHHQGQAQGQSYKSQVQGQPLDDGGGEIQTEKSQVKRHVEASPKGRYLRFEDKLGTGQYKVVYRSYDTSMGIEVAWNTVNIKNLPSQEKKRIMNEVRLLQNLEHKNLVQFHGSWVNREKEEVIFVTEIMQSGSLME